jgi:hypothetical protein
MHFTNLGSPSVQSVNIRGTSSNGRKGGWYVDLVRDIISLLILHIFQGKSSRLPPFESEPIIFPWNTRARTQASRVFSQSLYQTSSNISRRSCHRQKAVSEPSSKEKSQKHSRSQELDSLLGALASTASGVARDGTSRTDGLVALADVAADVVVTTTDLTVNGSLVLRTTDALEVGGLGGLAGGGVDVTALGERDLAVVAGALAANLYFGTGKLLLDRLVDAGLESWKCLLAFRAFRDLYWRPHTGVRGTGGATGGVINAVGLLSTLGVEVALSLLGDGDGVLTLVCGRHYDRCGGWKVCWVCVGFVKVV